MLETTFAAPKNDPSSLRIGLSGPVHHSFAYAVELDGVRRSAVRELRAAAHFGCLMHDTLYGLGPQPGTTEIYVRADPSQKLEAIEARLVR